MTLNPLAKLTAEEYVKHYGPALFPENSAFLKQMSADLDALLSAERRKAALDAIDKCLWWVNSNPPPCFQKEYWDAVMRELRTRYEAGRARVSRGEEFDSTSEVQVS